MSRSDTNTFITVWLNDKLYDGRYYKNVLEESPLNDCYLLEADFF